MPIFCLCVVAKSAAVAAKFAGVFPIFLQVKFRLGVMVTTLHKNRRVPSPWMIITRMTKKPVKDEYIAKKTQFLRTFFKIPVFKKTQDILKTRVFQKNPCFLVSLKNPCFLVSLKNPCFLVSLKNPCFLVKNPSFIQKED